jgi:hypothetical protein
MTARHGTIGLITDMYVRVPFCAGLKCSYSLVQINIDGHHLLANLTTLYLERQFCKMAAIKTLAAEGSNPTAHNGQWASTSDFDTVPKMMVTKQYFKENNVPALHPQCFSTISTLHPLEPVEAFGW